MQIVSRSFISKEAIRNATLSDNIMRMVRKSFMPEWYITEEGKVVFYKVGEHIVIDSVELAK